MVWPQDSLSHHYTLSTFPCVKTVETAIMAPCSNRIPHPLSADPDFSPAHISISACFLPNASLLHKRHICMRLSVSKQNSFPHDLHLQSFQMLLVGYTDIKVGALPATTDTQMSCWTIQSISNLGLPLLRGHEHVGVERDIDTTFWEGDRLPDVIVPSFEACGVKRRYEVDISLGLQCRGTEVGGINCRKCVRKKLTVSQGQAGRVLFVQLRTPVHVSSGIPPGRRLASDAPGKIPVGGEAVPITYENAAMHRHREARQTHCGYDDDGLPVGAPPTYEEATMVSR